MIDFDTCKFVIWGYRLDHAYHTHSHVLDGFYRALQRSRQVLWLDNADDISGVDFSNTFFITDKESMVPGGYWPSKLPRISLPPIREDCFYAVHGCPMPELLGQKNYMYWNVFQCIAAANFPATAEKIYLDPHTLFHPSESHLLVRWATNLLPDEIEANKTSKVFRDDSDVIHYVGSRWWVNEKEVAAFHKACSDNEIRFEVTGAGANHVVVSFEDNIRLIQESYMAPAILGTHHVAEGYAPCRVFKNISYGQYGITNSAVVNDIFGGKLIYNPDCEQLFYDARDRLPKISPAELHDLMDDVAKNHTYLNRINSLVTAARMMTNR